MSDSGCTGVTSRSSFWCFATCIANYLGYILHSKYLVLQLHNLIIALESTFVFNILVDFYKFIRDYYDVNIMW